MDNGVWTRSMGPIASIGDDVLGGLFLTVDPQDRVFYIARAGGTR